MLSCVSLRLKRGAKVPKNPISRRKFNSAVGLMSLAAAAPFVHTRRARARESADVVVIGSGLSGLNAAWILSEAGADVLVLEGSNRIGGRVWSAEEKWVTNSGEAPIELGASQVGPSYARVLYAIDRLKLSTVPEDRSLLPFAYHLDGALIKGSEWPDSPHNRTVGDERQIPAVQFGPAMLARLNPLKELDDWLDPRFRDYDVSIHDLLARHGVSEGGIRLAGRQSDLHGVSALRLFQEQTRGSFEERFAGPKGDDGEPLEHWPKNIAGGTIALPLAMAAQLPREVRLGQQVTAMEIEPDAVNLRTLDGGRYPRQVCGRGHAVHGIAGRVYLAPAPRGRNSRPYSGSTTRKPRARSAGSGSPSGRKTDTSRRCFPTGPCGCSGRSTITPAKASTGGCSCSPTPRASRSPRGRRTAPCAS